jgi:acyl-CoA dehydrogenase
MVLTPAGDEDRANGILYRATGEKYYIGNGNVASMVSVFGRRGDIGEADAGEGYVFFAADSRHENYHLIDNVVHMQIYVSTFRLENYPVRESDILHTGVEAFAAALNTVNVGKFNLCTCTIGMTEHAFYEAITHAQNRILYGNPVTDFSHVRANFVDAYARLIAMKLFSQRCVDYFRSAGRNDRRYLLFNPMTKAKVTMEGETVIRALHDVIAAKGYEKNTMFREVAQLIGTLPRLEGTVHVNVGLVLKFMPNYMFNPAQYPQIGTRNDPADDIFFWDQGATRGAAKVQFADWAPIYEEHSSIPNVARFYEQATAFKTLLTTAAPDAAQQQDLDFMLNVGHLFSLIVYGQLILEQAALAGLDTDIVDQIFDIQIRDFGMYAVALQGKPSATQDQQNWALGAIRKPVADAERFDRVWQRVKAYDGAYEMRA